MFVIWSFQFIISFCYEVKNCSFIFTLQLGSLSSCGPWNRAQSKGRGRVLGLALIRIGEGIGRWCAVLSSTSCICKCAGVIFSKNITNQSRALQPSAQDDKRHQSTHSTLPHTVGTSQHGTPPTNAPNPCMQDYLQSLTPSYALQLCSFPGHTAAQHFQKMYRE